jgi:hypothetical protein
MMLFFAAFYARGRFSTQVELKSNVVRCFSDRKALLWRYPAIITLKLRGYIFFGTALKHVPTTPTTPHP